MEVNGKIIIFWGRIALKICEVQEESPTLFFENPKEPELFEFIKNEFGTYDSLMGWKGIVVKGKRN
jgi:hypothetical protein